MKRMKSLTYSALILFVKFSILCASPFQSSVEQGSQRKTIEPFLPLRALIKTTHKIFLFSSSPFHVPTYNSIDLLSQNEVSKFKSPCEHHLLSFADLQSCTAPQKASHSHLCLVEIKGEAFAVNQVQEKEYFDRTAEQLNSKLIIEQDIEEGFGEIEIRIEVWTVHMMREEDLRTNESNTNQVEDQKQKPETYQYQQQSPELKISLRQSKGFSSFNAIEEYSTAFYNFKSEDVSSESFFDSHLYSDSRWVVYSFHGIIRQEPSDPKVFSNEPLAKQLRISITAHSNMQLLIKQLEISQQRTNRFANLSNLNMVDQFQSKHICEQQFCDSSSSIDAFKLVFNPTINSCVFKEEFRCVGELFFESVSPEHKCVTGCGSSEYVYLIDGIYAICLQGFQTCNNNLNGIENCSTCDRTGSICFACSPGFRLDVHRNCQPIKVTESRISRILVTSENCKRPICLECVAGILCVTCKSPFINVHGTCTLCGRGSQLSSKLADAYCRKTTSSLACSNYDETAATCIGCYEGYYLSNSCNNRLTCTSDPTEFDITIPQPTTCGVCTITLANCVSCANQSQCLICESGYYLAIEDYAISNPRVVCMNACPVGFYADANGFCAPCGINCDSCAKGSLVCNACKTNYQVDIAYTIAFPSFHQRCVPTTRCPPNCDGCSVKTTCITCSPGYYLVSKLCVKCMDGCKTCNNSTICSECFDGTTNSASCSKPTCLEQQFVNADNICENCVADCLSCWNNRSCEICMPGYVLEKYLCLACPSNCSVCLDMNSCVSCKEGFKLNSDRKCDVNSSPTITCADTEYLVSGVCQPCNSVCAKCSDGTHCSVCKSGITPQNGMCAICSDSNTYIDDSHTCQTCPTGCAKCSNATKCTECADGYFSLPSTFLTCEQVSLCGDGNLNLQFVVHGALMSKVCDDGNTENDDGCSDLCQLEDGFTCSYDATQFKSICSAIVTPDPTDPTVNSFTMSSKKKSNESQETVIVIRFQQSITLSPQTRRSLVNSTNSIGEFIRDSIIVDISDVSRDNYSYSVSLHEDSKGCDGEFTTKVNIVAKKIKVSFTDQFKSTNNISNGYVEIDFPNTRPISSDEKDTVKVVTEVASVAGATFVASIVPVVVFSNFSLLFNALDLFQMIFYLQYINIRFPYNISEFLYIMTNFQLPISFNFIAKILEENAIDSSAKLPKPFSDGEVSGVFLENTGDSYSQVIILAISHLLLTAFVKFCENSNVRSFQNSAKFLRHKLKEGWEWGWYLDMYWEMYLSFVVGCMLQLYGVTFSDAQSIVNAVVFLFSLGLVVLSPVVFYWIIHRNRHELEEETMKQKWGMLYETLKIKNISAVHVFPDSKEVVKLPGINQLASEENKLSTSRLNSERKESNNELQKQSSNSLTQASSDCMYDKQRLNVVTGNVKQVNQSSNRISKYFFVSLYVRKFFFGILIVGLWDNPLVQLILLDSLNLVIVCYLVFAQPYEKNSHTNKGLVCEILMVIAQLSLKFLIGDDDEDASADESERMRIGWVFIVCCIGILGVQFVFIFVNLFVDMRNSIRGMCAKKEIVVKENSPTIKSSDIEMEENEVVDLEKTPNSQSTNSAGSPLKTVELKQRSDLNADDLQMSSTNRGLIPANSNRLRVIHFENRELAKLYQVGSDQRIIEIQKLVESGQLPGRRKNRFTFKKPS